MILIKHSFRSLTNLFFPHLCSGCGNDLFDEQCLCLSCIDKLPVTNFHLHAGNPVEKIFWGRIPIVNASSHLYFTKDSMLQHLLHRLKYQGDKEIGWYFGRCMGKSFLQSNRFLAVDALVPLPLHPSKQRKRGYNQAEILCEGICEEMKIPILNKVIIRPTATETQTHKNRVKRWENIEGKFLLSRPASIENRHVLLIDDVVTTGATLEACGHELLAAEGVRLSIATLAYTSR